MRIAIGLRLGITLTTLVLKLGTHGLSWSEGRLPLHASVNEIVHRALSSTKIPSCLEPNHLYRTDGMRPDVITLVPLS